MVPPSLLNRDLGGLRSPGPNAGATRITSSFAQKVKSGPSPDGSVNIDWVELKNLSGGLANLIYAKVVLTGK